MQSGSEFHILIMRLENEWPSRAAEVCDLLSFLELPQVTRVEEKVKKKSGWVYVYNIIDNFVTHK